MSPPFFIVMPLRDAMTTGFTPGLIFVAGACASAVTGVEAASPAAALEITKSRRLILLLIFSPGRWTGPSGGLLVYRLSLTSDDRSRYKVNI
jgi:hypothetical protein